MKYLKKFNEELKSHVYRSAARKLRKIVKDTPVLARAIDAEARATRLEEYENEIKNRENIEKWKSNCEKFKKYGTFNFEISRPGRPLIPPKVFPFYLAISLDFLSMEDCWDDYDDVNRNISFQFCVGLIPTTIEDCQELAMNYIHRDEFYNGYFWGWWLNVKYKVVDSVVNFGGIEIWDYEEHESRFQIADRKSANSLRGLMIDMFNQGFDYPSGYTDVTDMYDKIQISAIQGLDISSTFGIDMERIRQDLKKTQTINFYKQK
jgi:hypothetical protein